jgi:hypothetical protein
MKRFVWIVAVLFLAIGVLACELPVVGSSTPEVKKTIVVQQEILFQDDFSDSGSGWDQYSDEYAVTDYVDGMYRIWIGQSDYYNWATASKNFSDVQIEVDVKNVGEADGDAGIICRYQDSDNFYLLRITTDGYYGISKIYQGNEELLGATKLRQNNSIFTGGATNHLRAECVGNRLSFYANGTLLADLNDADLASGDVGLIGGTFDKERVDLRFDNFVVYRP